MIHQRKSPRWKEYDYSSPGGYFITICTKDRQHYFGEIINGEIILNELGKICEQEILHIEPSRDSIQIHEYVVMPNHIHMIIIIGDRLDASSGRDASLMRHNNDHHINKDGLLNRPYNGPSLGSITKLFKGKITKYANQNNIIFARQSRYHDHIIRNENEYNRIKYYINTNPQNRATDSLQ